MGRHSENSSDLIDLEFSGFEELRLLRRDADGRVFHAFLQNGDLIGVAAAAEGGLPALPDTLGVFDGARVFQDPSRSRAVSEELRAVLLAGDCHADGVLCHSDGRVAHQPVKAQAGDVQHVRGPEDDGLVFGADGLVIAPLIAVVELAPLVSVYRHFVRHERVQCHHLAFAVSDDLGVGVAPEEQVGHKRFPEHEGTHFRVWLVMEQQIQRVVDGLLLAAVLGVAVEVERQASHGLRQDADAGIHRRHLHGAPLGDGLARGGGAKVESVAAPRSAVLGSVPRTE